MKTVFMFSGQGAQYAGMGKNLYKNYPVAKEIFDRADNVLGYSIKDICFEDEQKLGETEFAQPAILTMSIAAMKVLEEEGVRADMTAGLSLGEYSAYVASEAMDFEEAVALVQKRGKFMAEAVPSGEGAMYAIIGLDTALVEEACAEATAEGDGLAVPANYNAPGQIVIAGHGSAGFPLAAQLLRRDQTAGYRVDGRDQIALRLVGEAAQRVKGALDEGAGVGGAMLHGPAPEHVFQRHGVFFDIEAVHLVLHQRDHLIIELVLGVVVLGLSEGALIGVGHVLPRGVEVGAVAVGNAVIGAVQRIADIAVNALVALLAPLGEVVGNARIAGEHVHAVGFSAGIAGGGGDDAGVIGRADLVEAAQRVVIGVVPLHGRVGDRADKESACHQSQNDGAAQQQGGASS